MLVPQSRNGKYKQIVADIFSALHPLQSGRALRIPKAELTNGAKSPLYLEARKAGRKITTLTDADFVYVWNNSE